MNPTRILIVEDEAVVAMHLAGRLETLGYEVTGKAATAEKALLLVDEQRPDLVMMDVRLKGEKDGIEAAQQIRDRFQMPVVFLTAYAEDATLERAKLAQPFGYILKPFEDRELKTVIEMALYKHKAEKEIRERELRFRTVVQNAQAVIFILDRNGVFELSEGLGLKALGLKAGEVVGRSALQMYKDYPAIIEHVRLALSGQTTQVVWEVQGLFFDAILTPRFDTDGAPMGLIGLATDITARKRAEAEKEKLQDQLLQARKMESVGRLAGGVAHDFNNMLQVILGNVTLSMEGVPVSSPLGEYLQEIKKAAQRSADLTRQLLAFARKQTVSLKILDLNDAVTGMLKMLQRLIGEDIHLAWLPGPALWPVKMDPSQIDQMLANLTVNARDAIGGVGKITIETANMTLDDIYARTHADCAPGDYVLLSISDTGCGMDPETQSHVFEPFFTTKGVGEGTGLGLATVYGIVKQNGGLLSVYSETKRGTTFKIYLPRVEAVVAEVEEAAETESRRGSETVLLVEDEEQILNLGRHILSLQGYIVLAARLPSEALNLAAQYAGPIHLLVTDVVMPGMNGRELRDRLLDIKPGLRCLFMSGYTANVIAHQGVVEEGVQFLQKPFTIEALTQSVRKVLEA